MFAEVKTPRGHRGTYLGMPKWGERRGKSIGWHDGREPAAVSDAEKDKTRGTRPTDLCQRSKGRQSFSVKFKGYTGCFVLILCSYDTSYQITFTKKILSFHSNEAIAKKNLISSLSRPLLAVMQRKVLIFPSDSVVPPRNAKRWVTTSTVICHRPCLQSASAMVEGFLSYRF